MAATATRTAAAESVGFFGEMSQSLGGWIENKVRGNEDDIIFYLMLTVMVVGTGLFLWRTIGRSRARVQLVGQPIAA